MAPFPRPPCVDGMVRLPDRKWRTSGLFGADIVVCKSSVFALASGDKLWGFHVGSNQPVVMRKAKYGWGVVVWLYVIWQSQARGLTEGRVR